MLAIFFGGIFILSFIAPIIQHFKGYPAGEEIYSLFNPICHQYPTRCIWAFGLPAALCARCATAYLGIALSAFFIKFNIKYIKRIEIGLLFLFIASIDATFQAFKLIESINLLRIVSGILGGVAVFLIFYPLPIRKGHQYENSIVNYSGFFN